MNRNIDDLAEQVVAGIAAAGLHQGRHLVAIAGPPGSGKSTLAQQVCDHLNRVGHKAALVAMDGFHLANDVLRDRGTLSRKGAPETFDLAGFANLVSRLTDGSEVIAPVFDRALDLSIGAASVIPAGENIVIVEGNYLLLDAPGWRDLSRFWSYTVFLDVPEQELRVRLIRRWREYGFSDAEAASKAEGNDLSNARLVTACVTRAHLVL